MTGMSNPDLDVARVVEEALATPDEQRRWDLVGLLHTDGGAEALEIATRLAGHADPVRRELASDVLGQLGAGPGRAASAGPFREAATDVLLAMADREDDPAVLRSIAIGLGHLGDPRGLVPLARMHTHAEPRVRSGVVSGLLGRPEAAALDLLITLSADSAAEVRDWATFGLARQTGQDFPRLREALAARLADDDPDTRAEAIHGLAGRGDVRALEPLLDALVDVARYSDAALLTEALYALAAATADARLLPHLRACAEPGDESEELLAALARYARR